MTKLNIVSVDDDLGNSFKGVAKIMNHSGQSKKYLYAEKTVQV